MLGQVVKGSLVRFSIDHDRDRERSRIAVVICERRGIHDSAIAIPITIRFHEHDHGCCYYHFSGEVGAITVAIATVIVESNRGNS